MANYTRNIGVDVQWDDKAFTNVIIAACKSSTNVMAANAKTTIKRDEDIDVYEEQEGGTLKWLLDQYGLSQYTVSGKLKDGFRKMVTSGSVRHYKKQSVYQMLNYGILNEETKWYGLDSVEKGASIVEDGYRPLPSNSNTSKLKFARNPYPGMGYWMIFENGFEGGEGDTNYKPRGQIYESLRNVVTNHLVVGTGGVNQFRLNPNFNKRWGKTLTELINNSFK
ncbi:MAG: hypothetical protein PHN69_02435 [Candidatus Pacebacteria bacterium]|nr:hypothetical protein [Candidatus Paceibacterota bacterium]